MQLGFCVISIQLCQQLPCLVWHTEYWVVSCAEPIVRYNPTLKSN